MKNNAQSKNKSVFDKGFHKLFYNNKYLAVFSFIAAIILWVVVVIEFSPETTYVIKDVPVLISTENTTAERLNFAAFTDKEFKVDVTIRGKRYAINKKELLPTDITVTANLNSVNSVGTHNLQLIAVKNDRTADFEIVSLSQEEISVFFDIYKEIEIDLKTKPLPSELIPEGYYSSGAVASPKSVLVGGPATEINKIDKENVYAKIDPEELEQKSVIEETTHFHSKIDLIDAYGNALKFVKIIDPSPMLVVPVMKKAEFATGVEFSNTPDDYENRYITSCTIDPPTLNVYVTPDVISTLNEVTVGTIDFSQLKEGKNVLTFSKEEISANITVADEIDEITVTVEVANVASKTVNISKSQISFPGKPDNYQIKLVEGSSSIPGVTIYGSEEDISKVTSDSIYATVNLSNYDEGVGRKTVVVDISINNNNCWVYGVYELLIDVVKTQE